MLRAKAPVKRSVKPASSQLVDAIQQLFTLKYKWRCRRNNVMSGRLASGGWIRGGTKGEADLTVYVPGRMHRPGKEWDVTSMPRFHILHVEVKHGTGRQSHEQKLWQQCVEANGEFYVVCRSQEDAEKFLREKGWI